jgi:hypothetical protein
MITQFEPLSAPEKELLLKAPALLSVLASCPAQEINPTRRKDAIKLAHLRTFTAPPQLSPYYREVESRFEADFDATAAQYSPFDTTKRAALKDEIAEVNRLLSKLPDDYGALLHKSLDSYAYHVKRSTHTVFRDFIFPQAYSRL